MNSTHFAHLPKLKFGIDVDEPSQKASISKVHFPSAPPPWLKSAELLRVQRAPRARWELLNGTCETLREETFRLTLHSIAGARTRYFNHSCAPKGRSSTFPVLNTTERRWHRCRQPPTCEETLQREACISRGRSHVVSLESSLLLEGAATSPFTLYSYHPRRTQTHRGEKSHLDFAAKFPKLRRRRAGFGCLVTAGYSTWGNRMRA